LSVKPLDVIGCFVRLEGVAVPVDLVEDPGQRCAIN
jgi:hypothetical protein